MVIYQNRSSGQIEANYFDSSKHVIHCKLAATDKTDFAQFVSDAPSGPVFRLSFMLGTSTRLTLTFEVKPPGTEAGFQTVTFRSKEWYRNRLVFSSSKRLKQ